MKQYAFLILSNAVALKADAYQWMVCKRKGSKWVPVTFHTSIESALRKVQYDYLRESGSTSACKLIEALSYENQKLMDVITERLACDQITGEGKSCLIQ
jgi:hypothetical protein